MPSTGNFGFPHKQSSEDNFEYDLFRDHKPRKKIKRQYFQRLDNTYPFINKKEIEYDKRGNIIKRIEWRYGSKVITYTNWSTGQEMELTYYMTGPYRVIFDTANVGTEHDLFEEFYTLISIREKTIDNYYNTNSGKIIFPMEESTGPYTIIKKGDICYDRKGRLCFASHGDDHSYIAIPSHRRIADSTYGVDSFFYTYDRKGHIRYAQCIFNYGPHYRRQSFYQYKYDRYGDPLTETESISVDSFGHSYQLPPFVNIKCYYASKHKCTKIKHFRRDSNSYFIEHIKYWGHDSTVISYFTDTSRTDYDPVIDRAPHPADLPVPHIYRRFVYHWNKQGYIEMAEGGDIPNPAYHQEPPQYPFRWGRGDSVLKLPDSDQDIVQHLKYLWAYDYY